MCGACTYKTQYMSQMKLHLGKKNKCYPDGHYPKIIDLKEQEEERKRAIEEESSKQEPTKQEFSEHVRHNRKTIQVVPNTITSSTKEENNTINTTNDIFVITLHINERDYIVALYDFFCDQDIKLFEKYSKPNTIVTRTEIINGVTYTTTDKHNSYFVIELQPDHVWFYWNSLKHIKASENFKHNKEEIKEKINNDTIFTVFENCDIELVKKDFEEFNKKYAINNKNELIDQFISFLNMY